MDDDYKEEELMRQSIALLNEFCHIGYCACVFNPTTGTPTFHFLNPLVPYRLGYANYINRIHFSPQLIKNTKEKFILYV
jgi:hypothetical protein